MPEGNSVSRMNSKKIYFASDLHLGLPTFTKSRERESLFVKWLDAIRTRRRRNFPLGDIFDYWYEYRRVIPKGLSVFWGKLQR